MRGDEDTIELGEAELREITGYAAAAARRVLPLFEEGLPADARAREAIEAAERYAAGGRRTAELRRRAWAAHRAAREAATREAGTWAGGAAAGDAAAVVDAARAASHAAAAAYLHPRASAHQVKHVLGAAAHAARAAELAAGGDARVAAAALERARAEAPAAVVAVLGRLPVAPPGGGRVGAFIRELDAALRG
ncbi:exonuclease SbcC [Streptomyces sp. OF3]|uniref:Exonuclease SbcC n=1 Tax=Streptomyces alkaliterrae TaxID=2213162 RepID=A0A7W3ZN05_9ACTN|nr:exonuclease SbcC [Streptomyces alkaliterrae]MBB1254066.1 exonuclease SbcC [Streptomyces alkaliterrae]